MTCNEFYSKIPSAIDQLQEQCHTFAGHCTGVKHMVLWQNWQDVPRTRQGNQFMSNNCCVIRVAQ